MRCEQELYWQNYTVTLAKIKIRKLSANHHEFIKKFNIKIQNFFRKFVRCRLVSRWFLPIFLDFLKIFDYLWNLEFIFFFSYYINVCRCFESSMRHDIEWNFFHIICFPIKVPFFLQVFWRITAYKLQRSFALFDTRRRICFWSDQALGEP